MYLSKYELERVFARNFLATSLIGDIHVYGLEVSDVPSIKGNFSIIANSTDASVTFSHGKSSFRDLEVYAGRDINVERPLSTIAGDLSLTFLRGMLTARFLTSFKVMNLESKTGSIVVKDTPAKFMADSFFLKRNLTVTRSAHAYFTIETERHFECASMITLVGDYNTTNASNQNWNKMGLTVIAGTIDLGMHCTILGNHTGDTLYFRPSCSGSDCEITFGRIFPYDLKFMLSDVEVQRIATRGKLVIGQLGTDRVKRIRVDGVNLAHGPTRIWYPYICQSVDP
eukprot:TRINITY_DN9060_c0_g1_i1.p1 TRINITY_DN9060_c0_g1~~TRINITY_DN9060_c0_g1_i1.p1  ORF type:complete len:284 (-),score=9.33 TRINITY_DN9060_c0_g1_i1:42-893(-)